MGSDNCKTILQSTDQNISKIVLQVHEKDKLRIINNLCKRKSFNSHVFPILKVKEGQKVFCSNEFVYLQIQIPKSESFTSDLTNNFTLQQKQFLLLKLLYGFGELYRYIGSAFSIKEKMIRYDTNNNIYVWYNENMLQDMPEQLVEQQETSMTSNILNIMRMNNYYRRNLTFIELIVLLKKNTQKQVNRIYKVNIQSKTTLDKQKFSSTHNTDMVGSIEQFTEISQTSSIIIYEPTFNSRIFN